MKIKNKFFLDPDLGGGFGNGEGEGQSNGFEGEGVVTATPAPSPTLDAKAFAESFAPMIAQQFQQNAPRQQAPQLSREEAAKLLNVYNIDDGFIQEFGNLETQKSAFEKFRDGVIKQADTIMQARMYEMQQQFDQKLSPVQSLLQERANEEAEQAFGKRYSQLADPKSKPFVTGMAQQLHAAGKFNGLSRDQSFDLLANNLAEVIKVHNPTFQLIPPGQSAGALGASPNRITPQVHGSGSGGSGSGDMNGNGQKALPKAASLFPKIRG